MQILEIINNETYLIFKGSHFSNYFKLPFTIGITFD